MPMLFFRGKKKGGRGWLLEGRERQGEAGERHISLPFQKFGNFEIREKNFFDSCLPQKYAGWEKLGK